MGPRFTIGNDFNVVDDWGHVVGRFTPAGGGMDGCLAILLLVVLWGVGFIFYLLFRLIQAGFKALFAGQWILAVIFLSPLWISLAVIAFTMASAAAFAIPGMLAQKTADEQQTQALNKVESHLEEADNAEGTLSLFTEYGDIKVTKKSGLQTADDIRSCLGYAIDACEEYFKTNRGFWLYEIAMPSNDGLTMGESTGAFAFPQDFFVVENNGYGDDDNCFLESWDGRAFEPSIYPNTNPGLLYCEAKSTDAGTIELDLFGPAWNKPDYRFKLTLDPYTGLFTKDK